MEAKRSLAFSVSESGSQDRTKSTMSFCSGDTGGIRSRSSAQGRCLYLRSVDSGHFSASARVWQLAQRTIRLGALLSCVLHQGIMWAFSKATGSQSTAQRCRTSNRRSSAIALGMVGRLLMGFNGLQEFLGIVSVIDLDYRF